MVKHRFRYMPMMSMTQNQIAELFDTSKQNISNHISNILKNKELDEVSVVKEYLTAAEDGKNYPKVKKMQV